MAGEGIKELFEEIQKKIMSDVVTLEVEKSDINRILLDDGRHDKQKRNNDGCCGSNIKTPTRCQFCCILTYYYCCCLCCEKEKKNSN